MANVVELLHKIPLHAHRTHYSCALLSPIYDTDTEAKTPIFKMLSLFGFDLLCLGLLRLLAALLEHRFKVRIASG